MLVWFGVVLALTPLALLALFLLVSDIDYRWESHVAHFWLVLAAALVTLGLGYAVSATARRRRDARLFLISLAFMASFGFLALHALGDAERAARRKCRLRARDAGRPRRRGVARRRLRARAEPIAGHGRHATLAAPRHRPGRRAAALGRRLAHRDLAAGLADRSRATRRLAGRTRRGRNRPLRPGRGRLLPDLPPPRCDVRLRRHLRPRAPRGGDGRHRVGPQLARLVVGVARAHAARVRGDRASPPAASGTRSGSARSTSTRRWPARGT